MKKQINLRFLKYRAVCDRGDYTGDWRDTRRQASIDGNNHVSEPGKNTHTYTIETRQG